MNCNCEKNKNICDKCCKMYAKDVCYTGPDLNCIDVFPKEKNVENYLIKIDEIICMLLAQHLDFVILTLNVNGFLINTFTAVGQEDTTFNLEFDNIGTGSEIYKGLNTLTKVNEFRTITETGNLITVEETDDEVEISIDEDNLIDFIQSNQKTYSIDNVGAGAEIYVAPDDIVANNTEFNLKSIKSSSVGSGTSIVKDIDILSNPNEINLRFKSINSPNISIVENVDGGLELTAPDNSPFRYLIAFYVNSNYVPTIDSPADGSIIRPFPTFEEARTKYIGTGDLINPQYEGATIILQTNSTAINNPTVNRLIIHFENNANLTYTGTQLITGDSEVATDPDLNLRNDYMFDTEILYPLVPKNISNNSLTKTIYLSLTGIGSITRTNGIGLVRGLGSNRNGLGLSGDNDCSIQIGQTDEDVITLHERFEYPPSIEDGDTTDSSNVTYESHYGVPYKYTTQLLPTVPLLYSRYESVLPFKWGVSTSGLVNFITVANTAIRVIGGTSTMLLTGNKMNFIVFGQLVSTTSGTKLVDFPSVYNPQPNRNFIELDNANLYLNELLMLDSAGYSFTAIDNFFKIENNGNFVSGKMEIDTNMYVNEFINLSDISNTQNFFNLCDNKLGSSIDISQGRYFLDTTESNFLLKMPKTFVTSFLNMATTSVNITGATDGTLTSFFGTPIISNIMNYANDTAAAAGGLIINSVYFNTTTNALDIL